MEGNAPDTNGTPASTNEALEELYESLAGEDQYIEDPEGSGFYRKVTTNG